MNDINLRLCGTGQAVTDTVPGAVSSAWLDLDSLGAGNNRLLGGGQIVVARFACQVAANPAADPDNTVEFSIVLTPITLATPTTARTVPTPTFTNGTDVVNSTAHGLPNGTLVKITATGGSPTGLAADTHYWVINATANTFQLAATPGGVAVLFTNDGTPAHTITWYPTPLVSSGAIPTQKIVVGSVCELVIPPGFRPPTNNVIHRYLYAMFSGPTDITAGTFTCDLTSGFSMEGKPFNKVNYVTA
jgi:hypothetical protein